MQNSFRISAHWNRIKNKIGSSLFSLFSPVHRVLANHCASNYEKNFKRINLINAQWGGTTATPYWFSPSFPALYCFFCCLASHFHFVLSCYSKSYFTVSCIDDAHDVWWLLLVLEHKQDLWAPQLISKQTNKKIVPIISGGSYKGH